MEKGARVLVASKWIFDKDGGCSLVKNLLLWEAVWTGNSNPIELIIGYVVALGVFY